MVNNVQVFPEFDKVFMNNGESILDVGCGGINYEDNANHDWWTKFLYFKKKVGTDIWEPNIEWRKKHFPGDTFYVMDAMEIGDRFKPKSFDVVHCQNVIEHLEKDKALKLVRKMERIAKKQVILGTPRGFRQTGVIRGNPYEIHLCVFTDDELMRMGYNVIVFSDYYLCHKIIRMPVTSKHNPVIDKPTIAQIESIAPKRVVDVGAGDGFYGKLVRYIDPEAYSIGVEIHGPYKDEYRLDCAYDDLVIGDIVDVIDNSEIHGDLIIFGDVLEHLEKENVFKVLDKAVKKFKYIIINSPKGYQKQPHPISSEVHRCGLNRNDFLKYNIIEYNDFPRIFNMLIKGEVNEIKKLE